MFVLAQKNAREIRYKRYALSEEKTFDTIFIPNKEGLLQSLNDFLQRRGKFSISGFPNKLGLLLHGPPGTGESKSDDNNDDDLSVEYSNRCCSSNFFTLSLSLLLSLYTCAGKTSLIKAIANFTKRSIVNIPLSRIRTNGELMEIMFDQKLSVIGEDIEIRLQHEKVIFVIEDIDAATSIVHRKKRKATLKPRVNGMNGCLPDEQIGVVRGKSAIDEDIMESSGALWKGFFFFGMCISLLFTDTGKTGFFFKKKQKKNTKDL